MTDDSIPCEVGPIHMVQRLFKAFEYQVLRLGNAISIKIDYSGPLSLGRDCTSRANICCYFCFERHVTVNAQLLQTLYHINQPKYKMWNEVSETFIICSGFIFGLVFRFVFRLSVITLSKLGFDRHEGLTSTFSR